MASGDARPIARKNVAYRVTFPILDADGDLVTGATGLDSEVSKDGGTFADCTNEATEIATSSGLYFLDLTSTEMDADTVAVIVKTSSAGAKTTPIVLYPEEAGDVRVDVVQVSGDSTAADNAELFFDGTGYAGGTTKLDVNVVSMAAGTVTAAAIATGAIDADAIADNAIDAGAIASDAITAAKIAADAITAAKIADGAIDAATFAAGAINAAAIASDAITAAKIAADAITAAKIADGAIDAATFASGAITATAIAADAIGASELAADAVAEIADAVWDEALSGHVAAGSFGRTLQVIREETAQTGAAGSITLDASASASDDFYNNTIIQIIDGTGVGQSRIISDYVGATKVATVNGNWVTNPSSDSVFVIRAFGAIPGATAPTAGEVADAVWDEARSGHTTGGTFGEYVLADATRISGDATAADNAEAFFDGTGYAGTNNVIPNVTTVTGNVNGNVGGNVTGSVGSVASGGITAASIADNAIDAGAIAADAITAAKIADGAIDAATFASGAITASAIATDAITAAKIAADAIGASELAADAVTEIQAAVAAGAVASVTGNVGGNVTGSVGSLATQAKADVNAEVLDVLATDTFAEAAAVPAATSTLKDKINWLFILARNKITQTSTTQSVRNDADSATVASSTVADDGTTFSRGEFS